MITLKNICKEYINGGEAVQVLQDINLHIEKGTILAIMGRSGCGKTTLLNIIGGITKPTTGEVWIEGKQVDYQTSKTLYALRREYFGYVVQNFALISQKTVWENVALPIYSKAGRKHRKQIVDELLDEVGVLDKKTKYPYQLSNGERQRVAIARALSDNKKIILADEPTGALDYENAEKIIDLLNKVVKEREITALIVTHDKEVAEKCDKTCYISYGKII